MRNVCLILSWAAIPDKGNHEPLVASVIRLRNDVVRGLSLKNGVDFFYFYGLIVIAVMVQQRILVDGFTFPNASVRLNLPFQKKENALNAYEHHPFLIN